ncbi:MAG: HD domain-containing protein [Termitinemataceae bacterium]|nr:MAG: HD domain-containing protein [Termitinemataceae bacterium]
MKNAELFNEYARDILNHELFLLGKNVFSHGSISIYEHSVAVAALAFSMAEDKKNIDKRCIVRAALLHDFFLYEWHVWGWRYIMHGWAHPAIAANKAREVFGINDREYSCIRTHMWPWTFWRLPRCREGWIISMADKIVALKEALFCRGRRSHLKDPIALTAGETEGLVSRGVY